MKLTEEDIVKRNQVVTGFEYRQEHAPYGTLLMAPPNEPGYGEWHVVSESFISAGVTVVWRRYVMFPLAVEANDAGELDETQT